MKNKIVVALQTIKDYCHSNARCDTCIFKVIDGDYVIGCKISEWDKMPENWPIDEVEHEK